MLETTLAPADQIPDDMHFFEEMCSKGDIKHTWNPKKPADVSEAKLMFEAMTAKGFRAFRMVKGGGQGEVMDAFDPAARRVLFVPPMQGG